MSVARGPTHPRTEDPQRLEAWLTARALPVESVVRLAGGASPRTYWRATLVSPLPNGRTTAIVMALPEDALAPTEHGGTLALSSATAQAPAERELPWLAMARFLEDLDLPVPEYYVADVSAGYVLIEDLGDERFFDRLQGVSSASRSALYGEALQLLADWHHAVAGRIPAHGVPTFGRDHLFAELAEFADMALEARLGVTLSPGERKLLLQVGDTLANELLSGPQVLAHRDFQSQNLMVTPRGLVLIDFQDAFIAPDVYDLVALLRDSYIVLSPLELDHHLARFARLTTADEGHLRDRFHLQTIQRKLKDAGRFETLSRRGKTQFLAWFADSIGYVVHALQASGRFPDLHDLLVTLLPEARAVAHATPDP